MCGRFTFNSNPKDIEKKFDITDITCKLPLSYNIAPTHEVLAIIRYKDSNKLGKLYWGLVPPWAKDLSNVGKLINARSETAAEKPSFNNAFAKRRCIILADGFYEWQKTEKTKQPWYFKLPSGKPFGFAGFWEVWKSSEGQKYNSCTILTTVASESVIHVHDRMPVILQPDAVSDWLNPDTHDIGQLKEVLNDGKVEDLTGYPVTNKINSPSFNDPSCIKPLEQ